LCTLSISDLSTTQIGNENCLPCHQLLLFNIDNEPLFARVDALR
jgi:hypothetical protein